MGEVVAAEQDKMTENIMNCPLCKEEVYSEIGKGCKMCGMPLSDNKKDFCSKSCRVKYNKINILNKSIRAGEKNGV